MSDSQKFVIWGSAGHAKVLWDLISHWAGRVVALFDNNPAAIPAISGAPLFIGVDGFKSWLKGIDSVSAINGIVAIGGARGPERILIQKFFEEHGLQVPILLHPAASVSPTSLLGEGSQILAHAIVAAEATIGRACIINHKASVDHECILGDGVHLAPGATLCGEVALEDYVFVGAGATILPRVRIGEGSIIGAGAVVTKDIPRRSVVIGVPGKVVKRLG